MRANAALVPDHQRSLIGELEAAFDAWLAAMLPETSSVGNRAAAGFTLRTLLLSLLVCAHMYYDSVHHILHQCAHFCYYDIVQSSPVIMCTLLETL